jgi:hypothetical protein
MFSMCSAVTAGSKYSASRDISVQNIQPVGIFQYRIFRKEGMPEGEGRKVGEGRKEAKPEGEGRKECRKMKEGRKEGEGKKEGRKAER